MAADSERVDDLTTLSHIAETLNRAVDVRGVLGSTLHRLLELMGLQTGWIFLADPAPREPRAEQDYTLAAHSHLPPALALDHHAAWEGTCDCQGLCNSGRLDQAYNAVRCSRLAAAAGDRQGLAVHASAPLRSADRTLGILNVAASDWTEFSPRALALLGSVGSLMGVALERARLYDLLQERRVDEQAALLDLSNQLLARLDLDDVLRYVVDAVPHLLRADACALLLPTDDPAWLAFYAAGGWRHDPVAAGHRLPAGEHTGPGRVMLLRRPWQVADVATAEPDSPLTSWLLAEDLHGHTVVPLIAGGQAIGALMIDSRRPRLLDADELRFLQLMANQAAIAVVTARLHEEEVKQQRLQQELSVARRIQLSLLPKSCPQVPGWEIDAFYRPAELVGGDFYDVFDLPNRPGHLGLVVADVTDKGVPAALFMALSRTIIRSTAFGRRGPAAALKRANELILSDSQAGLFLTAFYAVLDTASGRLAYACAGHDRPLWWHAAGGRVQELAARGLPLGALAGVDLEERTVRLARGDVLLLYTDGVTDAMDSRAELFGRERLAAALAAAPHDAAHQVVAAVRAAVTAFSGSGRPSDDLTLLAVKYL